MKLTVNAPAKINLTLDIIGRRNDGYHLVKNADAVGRRVRHGNGLG